MTGKTSQTLGPTSLLTSVRSKKRLRKMNAMFSQPTAYKKVASGSEQLGLDAAPECRQGEEIRKIQENDILLNISPTLRWDIIPSDF